MIWYRGFPGSSDGKQSACNIHTSYICVYFYFVYIYVFCLSIHQWTLALHCFQLLATVYNTTMNRMNRIYKYLFECLHWFLWSIYSEVELLHHMIILYIIFWGTAIYPELFLNYLYLVGPRPPHLFLYLTGHFNMLSKCSVLPESTLRFQLPLFC